MAQPELSGSIHPLGRPSFALSATDIRPGRATEPPAAHQTAHQTSLAHPVKVRTAHQNFAWFAAPALLPWAAVPACAPHPASHRPPEGADFFLPNSLPLLWRRRFSRSILQTINHTSRPPPRARPPLSPLSKPTAIRSRSNRPLYSQPFPLKTLFLAARPLFSAVGRSSPQPPPTKPVFPRLPRYLRVYVHRKSQDFRYVLLPALP